MTYLEMVNEVLKRLREAEVTAVSDTTYSELMGAFVKQAYVRVANAYEWPQLDETDDASISATDTSYTITSGDSGEGVHDIHSVFNVTTEKFLFPRPYKWVRDRLTDNTDQEEPLFYAYGGETADGTTTIHFYRTSNDSYTIRTSFNRKPDLKNTLSDSTFIKLPEMPIILAAYALAVSERGEDGGTTFNEADAEARMSLSDTIALYAGNLDSCSMNWVVN